MTDVDIPEAFGGLFIPNRYKAAHGGRGSAKSHSFAKALLLRGGERTTRILCGREIQKSIKDSVKQLLDSQIASMGMRDFYTSTREGITGRNGSEFIFSGLGQMTTDQIKSYEGVDIAWIEEAQTISADSLEVLIPTIRAPGSELWFSWNPRHQSDPVDRRFRGLDVPARSWVQRVNYDDNPFFPAELEEERLYDKAHIPDRYAHIWLGDYEPQAIGAIWSRQNIADNRLAEAPDLSRVLVSVDPAVSSDETSNEHGIMVVARGQDSNQGYVLDDLTTAGAPAKWAGRAVAAFDKWEADAVVIERNQGGDMCRHTLQTVRPGLPIVEVVATRGKHVRAEPISSLYGLDQIHHVGSFPELEAQMCLMTAAGFEGEGSPDRVDALVWGFTELFPAMLRRKKRLVGHERPRAGGWMG